MDEVAKSKAFDPVQQFEKWYEIRHKDVQQLKGGLTLLRQYGGLVPILKTVYPAVHFDEGKFKNLPKVTLHFSVLRNINPFDRKNEVITNR